MFAVSVDLRSLRVTRVEHMKQVEQMEKPKERQKDSKEDNGQTKRKTVKMKNDKIKEKQ